MLALHVAACSAPRDSASASENTDRSIIQAALVRVDTLPESDSLFVGRVQGALVDPAGIFVTDQSGRRALFWPSNGSRPTAIGRPGSGPGEFLGPINATRWRGDTIAITDLVSQTVSIFAEQGARFVFRRSVGGFPLTVAAVGKSLVVGSSSAARRTGLVAVTTGDTTVRHAAEFPQDMLRNPLALQVFPISTVGAFGDSILVGFWLSNELRVLNANFTTVAHIVVPAVRRRRLPDNLDAALKPVFETPERLTLVPDLNGLFTDDQRRIIVVHKEWTSPSGGINDWSAFATEAILRIFISVVDLGRSRACVDIALPSDWAENPAITMSPRGVVAVGHRIGEQDRPVLEVRTYDLPLRECNWQPIVVRAMNDATSKPLSK